MKNLSRKISYLLRHNPEDLVMDKRGWVSVDDLLKKLSITIESLDDIVTNNDKKRFGYNETKTKIRAHQGHSGKLNLRIDFKEIQFPADYYHGTSTSKVSLILKKGLKPMSRAQVHLSKDVITATTVGMRHGSDVTIFVIDGGRMKQDGLKLYLSENNVVLVDEVPPKYITIWRD